MAATVAAVPASLLPPADAPLTQTFAALLARTRTGDKPAAARLYRDLMRCRNHATRQTSALYWSNTILAQKPENTSEQELEAAQSRLEQSAEYAALCHGTDERQLGQLTPVMLAAARLGVADARDCYVHRGPRIDLPTLLHHPDYLTVYAREAPALIDAAIKAGDWKMVDMLQYAYGNHDSGSLISGLVEQDPLTQYRYLKLYRLGAEDRAATRVDAQLSRATATLDPAALIEADAWARQTYDHYFQNSGESTSVAPQYWDACGIAP
ncbi:MAG TPA: hypothetical protein VFN09_07455 [Rhodanobacteraceae bacterium]|nr:hypothetical protein [Rhodanobacteraceae bacterium]